MGAFASLDDYMNRMTGGNSGAPENLLFAKYTSRDGGTSVAVISVQQFQSCWRWDGIPNAGAVATTAATCDKSTTGALQFTNSGGSLVKRLVQGVTAGVDTSHNHVCLVVDRLVAIGGLNGTLNSSQPASITPGRYTGGEGNQIWVEIQTAIGSTGTTITAVYTNQAGTGSRTTISRRIGGTGSMEVATAIQLPLQAGDTGVQSVQSITLAATTGTAGDIAVVIVHPIATMCNVPLGPFGSLGTLPEIVDDACLTFIVTQSSTRLNFAGLLSMVDV